LPAAPSACRSAAWPSFDDAIRIQQPLRAELRSLPDDVMRANASKLRRAVACMFCTSLAGSGIIRPTVHRSSRHWSPHSTVVIVRASFRSQGLKAAKFVERTLAARGHDVTIVDPVPLNLPLLDRITRAPGPGAGAAQTSQRY
jgi:hypothetical protein